MQTPRIFLFLILHGLLYLTVTAISPYCDRNETITEYKQVTRTRHVAVKPSGFWKVFKKTKYVEETFIDQEPYIRYKLVTTCCDGFQMSQLNICEPICAQNCPEYAKCVEPNRCKCHDGYTTAVAPGTGAHYCEPVCAGGCPENGRCIRPNSCECLHGYRVQHDKCVPHCHSGCPHGGTCIKPNVCDCLPGNTAVGGTCEPICERGDGCRNGRCVETEECVCHAGYKKDMETEICKPINCDENDEECSEELYDNTESTTDVAETEPQSKELIILSTPMPEVADESLENSRESKCASGFVPYNGECRDGTFTSQELDCRFKNCTEKRACPEGYILHTPEVEEATTTEKTRRTTVDAESSTTASSESTVMVDADMAMLSLRKLEPICITLEQYNVIMARTTDATESEGPTFAHILYIALGSALILGAFVLLVMHLLRRQQRGQMDVEGECKNDLCCAYDNKNSKLKPLVL